MRAALRRSGNATAAGSPSARRRCRGENPDRPHAGAGRSGSSDRRRSAESAPVLSRNHQGRPEPLLSALQRAASWEQRARKSVSRQAQRRRQAEENRSCQGDDRGEGRVPTRRRRSNRAAESCRLAPARAARERPSGRGTGQVRRRPVLSPGFRRGAGGSADRDSRRPPLERRSRGVCPSSRQQQVGDVHTGDEQDERHRTGKQFERTADVLD